MSAQHRTALGRELMGLARALDSIRDLADTEHGRASVSDARRAYRMIAASLGLVSDELIHLGTTLATTTPIAGSPNLQPAGVSDVARLDRARFATVVREALRSCDRPDLLRTSPLCTSSWLAGRAKSADALADGRALAELLRDECRRLFTSPRDQILDRVIDRTFFHPACKQQVAAAELGLTYSTYRRYLAQAVGRLVDALYLACRSAAPERG